MEITARIWCTCDHENSIALASFRWGAIFCYSSSASFHLFCCHSKLTCYRLAKLDYFGILTFMAIGGFSCIDLAKDLNPAVKRIYFQVGVVIIIAIATIIACFQEFGSPPWRAFRANLFLFFGSVVIIPVVHISWGGLCQSGCFKLLVAAGLSLGGGVFIYAKRLPERLWQNSIVDIFCSSHFLFHCLVALGSIFYYQILQKMAKECLSV